MSDPSAAKPTAPSWYGYWSDDVVVLGWPTTHELVDPGDERARLYVVAEGAAPPATWTVYEDWLRAPVDVEELEARRWTLRRRVAAARPIDVDEFGVVRRGTRWVALSELEATLFAPLLDQERRVVGRKALAAAAPWGADDGRRLLDATISRLRRRLRPLGITIHTVRSSGYLLERGLPPE
jgi:two-component system, OmpR family, response regulator